MLDRFGTGSHPHPEGCLTTFLDSHEYKHAQKTASMLTSVVIFRVHDAVNNHSPNMILLKSEIDHFFSRGTHRKHSGEALLKRKISAAAYNEGLSVTYVAPSTVPYLQYRGMSMDPGTPKRCEALREPPILELFIPIRSHDAEHISGDHGSADELRHMFHTSLRQVSQDLFIGVQFTECSVR